MNWNIESDILEHFPILEERGVLPVPVQLLQSRHSFWDKARAVREWRALYTVEQKDITHQWTVQRNKLQEQDEPPLPQSRNVDEITSIIIPKKLEFQSSHIDTNEILQTMHHQDMDDTLLLTSDDENDALSQMLEVVIDKQQQIEALEVIIGSKDD